MVLPTRESPPQQDLIEHYYSMTLSKCYRSSRERLSCIACHDPHVEPIAKKRLEHFNKSAWHATPTRVAHLAREAREQRANPADDCVGCHMQKRDVQVIPHSSITNHSILARPDEPFPDIAFEQTSSTLADLIHLNPAPGKKLLPATGLTLLQAYGELGRNVRNTRPAISPFSNNSNALNPTIRSCSPHWAIVICMLANIRKQSTLAARH